MFSTVQILPFYYIDSSSIFNSIQSNIRMLSVYYIIMGVNYQLNSKKISVRRSLQRVACDPCPERWTTACILFLRIFGFNLGHLTLPVRYWIFKEILEALCRCLLRLKSHGNQISRLRCALLEMTWWGIPFIRNDKRSRCHSDRSDAQHRAVEESGFGQRGLYDCW